MYDGHFTPLGFRRDVGCYNRAAKCWSPLQKAAPLPKDLASRPTSLPHARTRCLQDALLFAATAHRRLCRCCRKRYDFDFEAKAARADEIGNTGDSERNEGSQAGSSPIAEGRSSLLPQARMPNAYNLRVHPPPKVRICAQWRIRVGVVAGYIRWDGADTALLP